MSKGSKFLLSIAMLFLGVIIGFLVSPVKKGFYCGHNNGNTYCKDKPEKDNWYQKDEGDEEDDMPF